MAVGIWAEASEPRQTTTLVKHSGKPSGRAPTLAYGYGWVVQDYHGHREISHAGYIDGFRAHLTMLPDDRLGIVLLNNLDNIRQSFRNPTQHPEKIYDIQEVQDLWSLCVDVVNRMSSDIRGNKP